MGVRAEQVRAAIGSALDHQLHVRINLVPQAKAKSRGRAGIVMLEDGAVVKIGVAGGAERGETIANRRRRRGPAVRVRQVDFDRGPYLRNWRLTPSHEIALQPALIRPPALTVALRRALLL